MKAKFHIATREYSFIEPEVEGDTIEDIMSQYFEYERAYRVAVKEYKEKKEQEPPFENTGGRTAPSTPQPEDYLNKPKDKSVAYTDK